MTSKTTKPAPQPVEEVAIEHPAPGDRAKPSPVEAPIEAIPAVGELERAEEEADD